MPVKSNEPKLTCDAELIGAAHITVPVALIQCALSPTAKVVYMTLCSYVASGETAWPGQARIAEHSGVSDRTVRDALRELNSAAWGLVSVHRGGGGQTNRYHLHRFQAPGVVPFPAFQPTPEPPATPASEPVSAEIRPEEFSDQADQTGRIFRSDESDRKNFPIRMAENASDRKILPIRNSHTPTVENLSISTSYRYDTHSPLPPTGGGGETEAIPAETKKPKRARAAGKSDEAARELLRAFRRVRFPEGGDWSETQWLDQRAILKAAAADGISPECFAEATRAALDRYSDAKFVTPRAVARNYDALSAPLPPPAKQAPRAATSPNATPYAHSGAANPTGPISPTYGGIFSGDGRIAATMEKRPPALTKNQAAAATIRDTVRAAFAHAITTTAPAPDPEAAPASRPLILEAV